MTAGNDCFEDAALSEDLRRLMAELRAAREPCEALFTDLGQRLGEAIDKIGRLAGGLDSIAAAMAGEDWRLAVETLSRGGDRVAGLADSLAEDHRALAELSASAGRIGGSVERLRSIVAEVRALGVNAKIEASQLSASLDFTGFTEEIGRLASLAGEGLDVMAKQLKEVDDLAGTAAAEGASFQSRHGRDLQEVGERLRTALAAASREQQQAAAAVADFSGRSRRAGESISRAIVALQINDITRQRLEHVEQALEAARGILAGPDSSLSPKDVALMVGTVCRLQAGQLARARDSFDGEIVGLVESLRNLAREVDLIRTASSGSDGIANEVLVDRLDQELNAANALLRQYGQASLGLRRLVGSVSVAAGEMGRHVESVHSLDADMRVMGLNATLKCGRLGHEGRALSIIAHELRGCATRTEEQAGLLSKALLGMSAAADALTGGGAADRLHQDGGIDQLMATMTASAAGLAEICRGYQAGLGSIERTGGEVVALLRRTADGITVHHTLGQAVERLITRLEAVNGGIGSQSWTADPETERRILDLLRQRYTMASEREIHAMLLGENPEVAAEPAPAGGDDLDDILF